MKLKCLIVDDEPLAQRILEKFIGEMSFLQLIAKCSDAIEAMDVLQEKKIDLIFLDINMPRLSGINFLKTYKNPPMVIITTAYTEYAVESYELNVLDYLKKPFSFERFIKAVQKAKDFSMANKNLPDAEEKDENLDYIFIKANKKTVNVLINTIIYIEALGDYVKIYTESGSIVTYQSMKGIERLLPSKKFCRIHKSYIVSLSKIKSIIGNTVKIESGELPIGNSYKQAFFGRIYPV